MADRREYPRLRVALDATYRIEGSGSLHQATIANLCAGGAAFVVEEPVDPGTRIDPLRFSIGSGASTQVLSVGVETTRCSRRQGVGRADEYLVASSFLDIEPETQSRIHDFVLAELSGNDSSHAPRIDIEKPVALRFDRFDDFVTEVSRNLSATGMFIGTERPHPVGSTFDFVLQLGEDLKMVQGRAEVVWSRERQDGLDRPRGMGIRFLEMDPTSESVLRRLIDHHTSPAYPGEVPPEAGAESGELLEPLGANLDDLGSL